MLEINDLMTQNEILTACHQYTGLPSAIIQFVAMILLFWFVSWIAFDKESNWKKVGFQWFLLLILGILVLIFISYSPLTVESIFNIFR